MNSASFWVFRQSDYLMSFCVALCMTAVAVVVVKKSSVLFGIAVGTYSSVYVASSIAEILGISREDMLPPPPPPTEGEPGGAVL